MEDITRFPLVPFRNWDCRAVPAIYGNGIVAIQLIETDPSQFELSHHNLTCEDGDETGDVYRQTIATATVNLIDYEDKVLSLIGGAQGCYTFIKDYSENQGMLDALMQEKIVSPPVLWEPSGYVRVPLVEVYNSEIVDRWLELLDEQQKKDLGFWYKPQEINYVS